MGQTTHGPWVSGIAASVWPQALNLQQISTRSVRTRRAQLPTCDGVCESQPAICCRLRFSRSCASAKTSENFGVLPSATTPFFPGQSPTNVETSSQPCQLERAEGGRHENRDRSPCCVISDHHHEQADKESMPTRTWLQIGEKAIRLLVELDVEQNRAMGRPH
jgi:hypothetical protein